MRQLLLGSVGQGSLALGRPSPSVSNGVIRALLSSGSPHALTLVVDCKDIICTATITPHFLEDTLILLRHIFLGYYGQPMAVIEDLDIELESTFPVVK
jgi:hypothetical protein